MGNNPIIDNAICLELKYLYWLFSEPLIPLNEACDPDEQCEDPNADCIGGFCLCTARFYENNGVCGKQ